MLAFGGCCCGCRDGAVIPRWQNISKVRPAGDSGGTHYTHDPFPRLDVSTDAPTTCGDGADVCATAAAGTCGTWLEGGDLNGVSAQEIEAAVNDIMACAGDDSTHKQTDHNCYLKNGDTVDMTATRRLGGQWVLGKKFWHGSHAWTHTDGCTPDPNQTPSQTKYLTLEAVALEYHLLTVDSSDSAAYLDCNYDGSTTVNRYSGIRTQSLTVSQERYWQENDGRMTGLPATTKLQYQQITNGGGWYTADTTGPSIGTDPHLAYSPAPQVTLAASANSDVHCAGVSWPSDFSVIIGAGSIEDFVRWWNDVYVPANTLTSLPALPAVSDPNSYSQSFTVDDESVSVPGRYQHYEVTVTWGRTATNYSWNFIFKRYWSDADADPSRLEVAFSGALTLTDAYTSADCIADWKAALAAWDMSNLSLAKLRTDELLALAPLCCYDEVPNPLSPVSAFQSPVMDDYSGTPSGGVWPQVAWRDPNDFVWQDPSGHYYTTSSEATAGSAQIHPMRDGSILAHTQPGSDRHFWFSYGKLRRIAQKNDDCSETGMYLWQVYSHGDFSASPLPASTLRWMNNWEAQYDGYAVVGGGTPPHGNYPQGWMLEQSGVLTGGKYVEAVRTWPSVNYGEPCGAGKYAVDQTTVCCINAGDASAGFTVKLTGHAAAAPAVNDYILVEGDGIYKVTGVASTSPDGYGNAQWIISVGGKLDDLPDVTTTALDASLSGLGLLSDGATHLGTLRWPYAPGICGRAAITTAYDSGSGLVTITAADALPWLRKDVTLSPPKILVDLWNADMSTKVVAAAELTRASDTSFTLTHAAIPTAVWMTGKDYDYTHFESSPKYTGVHLVWGFSHRPNATGYTGTVPSWFAGVTGCTALSITQFNYTPSACPAMVGIAPFYTSGGAAAPVETFSNQVMFATPDDFQFDDSYGAFWLSAVELTMPDPFWQAPYKPDCAIESPDSLAWLEDNGSGQPDDLSLPHETAYYPHHPLVEAASNIPSGRSLPAGVELYYEPAALIAPPFYILGTGGIPIGGVDGSYSSVERPWGFALRACAGGNRFGSYYRSFTDCP